MKHLFLVIILISNFLTAQNKWSLADCISHAKEHNIDIVKQQFQNNIITEDITIAKGNYFPDLNFSGSQGFSLGNSFNISTGVGQQESRFNSFSLSSSLSLFNGFKNRYELQKSKLSTEKGAIDLNKLGLDLSLNIANNYLQVLFNKEIVSVAAEQEVISQQEVNRLHKLFQSALKSKSELLEMRSTYALDQKELLIAKNNLKNSLITLQELLDIKTIEDFDIKDILVIDFEDAVPLLNANDIYTKALETNPLLKSTQLSSDISEKNIQIAKSNFYPSLNFNYSYSSNYYHLQGSTDEVFNQQTNQNENNGFLTQLENNKTHYLGFSLTVPVFNRFYTQSSVDKSKVAMEIKQVEFENQKKELLNKIKIAHNDISTAKATLNATQSAVTSQEEAFTIAQKKYQRGLSTSYEFLESKSKYIQTKSEFIKAKYDYLFKIKVLEYYNQ